MVGNGEVSPSGRARTILPTLPPRFRDPAETRIVTQKQVAGVKGFGFEPGTVAGNEKPVSDLIAEQFYAAERREFALELWVCGVRALGKNEPKAIVLWRSGVVSEHENNPIADVDREPGEHAPHFGAQWRERVENKHVRGLRLGFRRTGHGCFQDGR
jgi:hypothetical protein